MLDARSKANCRCPTCGGPVSLDALYLPPLWRRILNAVQRHGEIHHEVLWFAIWGSDPNLGPNDLNTLNVHISKLNRRLKPGFAIRRTTPRSRNAPYRLVRITEAAE
jgi:hypothetical protein